MPLNHKLVELLAENQIAPKGKLEALLKTYEKQKNPPRTLEAVFCGASYTNPEQVAPFLPRAQDAPEISFQDLEPPDSNATLLLTVEQAETHQVLPYRLEGSTLSIATKFPCPMETVEALEELLDLAIVPTPIPQVWLTQFLQRHYQLEIPKTLQGLVDRWPLPAAPESSTKAHLDDPQKETKAETDQETPDTTPTTDQKAPEAPQVEETSTPSTTNEATEGQSQSLLDSINLGSSLDSFSLDLDDGLGSSALDFSGLLSKEKPAPTKPKVIEAPPTEASSTTLPEEEDASEESSFASERPLQSINIHELEQLLQRARTRDGTLELGLYFMASLSDQAGLFRLPKGRVTGHRLLASPSLERAMQSITISLSSDTVFQRIQDSLVPYSGPIPKNPADQCLFTLFDPQPKYVYFVPVRLKGRTVAALYGHRHNTPLSDEQFEELMRCSNLMANALEQVILQYKKGVREETNFIKKIIQALQHRDRELLDEKLVNIRNDVQAYLKAKSALETPSSSALPEMQTTELDEEEDDLLIDEPVFSKLPPKVIQATKSKEKKPETPTKPSTSETKTVAPPKTKKLEATSTSETAETSETTSREVPKTADPSSTTTTTTTTSDLLPDPTIATSTSDLLPDTNDPATTTPKVAPEKDDFLSPASDTDHLLPAAKTTDKRSKTAPLEALAPKDAKSLDPTQILAAKQPSKRSVTSPLEALANQENASEQEPSTDSEDSPLVIRSQSQSSLFASDAVSSDELATVSTTEPASKRTETPAFGMPAVVSSTPVSVEEKQQTPTPSSSGTPAFGTPAFDEKKETTSPPNTEASASKTNVEVDAKNEDAAPRNEGEIAAQIDTSSTQQEQEKTAPTKTEETPEAPDHTETDPTPAIETETSETTTSTSETTTSETKTLKGDPSLYETDELFDFEDEDNPPPKIQTSQAILDSIIGSNMQDVQTARDGAEVLGTVTSENPTLKAFFEPTQSAISVNSPEALAVTLDEMEPMKPTPNAKEETHAPKNPPSSAPSVEETVSPKAADLNDNQESVSKEEPTPPTSSPVQSQERILFQDSYDPGISLPSADEELVTFMNMLLRSNERLREVAVALLEDYPPQRVVATLLHYYPQALDTRYIKQDGTLEAEHSSTPTAIMWYLLDSYGADTANGLLPFLYSTRAQTQLITLTLLQRLPYQDILPHIFRQLLHTDNQVAQSAAKLLRRGGYPAVRETRQWLREQLADKDSPHLAKTIRILSKIRDKEAVRLFLDLLAHPDPDISEEAYDALKDVTKQNLPHHPKKWNKWWEKFGSKTHRIDWLIEGLQQKDTDLQESANEELCEYANEDFGFDPYAPRRQRNAAIQQWKQWRKSLTAST